MHIAQLLSYELHEVLVEMYFKRMAKDPVAKYRRVTIEQVQDADEAIFKFMAEATREGLGNDPATGAWPLDGPLQYAMIDEDVTYCLKPLPLPGSGSGGSSGSGNPRPQTGGQGGDAALKRRIQQLENENSNLKSSKQQRGNNNGGQGRKGGQQLAIKNQGGQGQGSKKKGPNGPKATGPPMPAELRGWCGSKHKDQNLCYDYNMKKGCSETASGMGLCSRGRHACAKLKGGVTCAGNHAAHACG